MIQARRHRLVPLLVALATWACGETGGTPDSPVEPPTTSAEIVVAGGLTFGACTAPGCEYSLPLRNLGPGCANNLRGQVRLYNGDVLLEADDWFLQPSRTLAPGETLGVEDCCFSADAVGRRTRFTAQQFWNNVDCN